MPSRRYLVVLCFLNLLRTRHLSVQVFVCGLVCGRDNSNDSRRFGERTRLSRRLSVKEMFVVDEVSILVPPGPGVKDCEKTDEKKTLGEEYRVGLL